MPNWCHNELTVRGKEEGVCEWVDRAARPVVDEDDQPLLFANFVPEPQYADSGDWWDWRIANWGTKWEPSFSEQIMEADGSPGGAFQRSSGEAVYRFDTAWGPPLEWLAKVSEKYPALSFQITFGEPGMDFGGRWLFENGEIKEFEEGEAGKYLEADLMWF